MSGAGGRSAQNAPAATFHKKRGEEVRAEIVIEGPAEPRGAPLPGSPAPAARRADFNARKELPLLLRQISETTKDTLRHEAHESFAEEQQYIRRYIDRQMQAHFKHQLNELKVQLSEFIKDFVQVKNSEIVNESLSRESVRAEQELREMQSALDGLQHSVSQLMGQGRAGEEGPGPAAPREPDAPEPPEALGRLEENERAISQLTAQNEELRQLLQAQQRRVAELQGSLSGLVEGELNGFFGDEVNFSVINKKKDDTLAEEWFPADMKLLHGEGTPRQTKTTLSSRTPVVPANVPASPGSVYSFLTAAAEKAPAAAQLPVRVTRLQLEPLLALPLGENVREAEFLIDANSFLTDLEGNPIIDDTGNLIKVSHAVVKDLASP